MKKLNINKLSEYPVVNIEEQTSLKGGVMLMVMVMQPRL